MALAGSVNCYFHILLYRSEVIAGVGSAGNARGVTVMLVHLVSRIYDYSFPHGYMASFLAVCISLGLSVEYVVIIIQVLC